MNADERRALNDARDRYPPCNRFDIYIVSRCAAFRAGWERKGAPEDSGYSEAWRAGLMAHGKWEATDGR